MIYFWLLYFLISILIIFSFYKLISNKFLRLLVLSILSGLLLSVWLLEPGNTNLAPIISILFLESTILESNGLMRLLRPLIGLTLTIFLIFSISILVKKNLFRKK